MFATVRSATLLGIDARLIEVEVELSTGLPLLSIIGLADMAVQEAKYRVQSALRAQGLQLPHKKITVNLAPAAVRKDGAALDLPIALGILLGAGVLEQGSLTNVLAVGELSLDGTLRPIRGSLAVASLARSLGLSKLIVPRGNAGEASALPGIEVLAPERLSELVAFLKGTGTLPAPEKNVPTPVPPAPVDLEDVRGQPMARRALEIAAAGAHNLLMVGPPGSGKTMLARRLPTILPPLAADEQIEVTKVWSAAGLTVADGGLIRDRPFRAPHHSASTAAVVGGGSTIRPGEVSLAHQGVLFLDEIPELSRTTLEALRQPLEDREVLIARARQVVRLPAAFMLVAAANPCPCGFAGDPRGRCRCTPAELHRYASRISGPLLDRIDLTIEVPGIAPESMLGAQLGEGSREVRIRVIRARARASERGARVNADLRGERLRRAVNLSGPALKLLTSAIESLELSARAIQRTLRVARTIADLSDHSEVDDSALAEALRYRSAHWSQARAA